MTTRPPAATPPGSADDGQEQQSLSSQPTSLVQHILDSLFSPGLNSPTRNIMNWSFYGLFVTLIAMALVTGGNIHVVLLLGIAIALWASVNWFLYELDKMPPSVRQTQQVPSQVASTEGKKEQ